VPLALQVSTPLPEHCVEPGLHEPLHWPLVHTLEQAVAVPQPPLALQTETLLPWHSVWLGAQTPWHVPPTHVCFVQALVGPQVPLGEHVCVPFVVALHCTAPGAHARHAPFQQTGVAPAHVVWFCQVPVASHC